ncbi:hypothetical protein [Amnibacterium endophyticum]|uniref:NYN domain-containing protein n=1 Tax=Amnibacterium endophyticum TaxID=2109337 RepID=A0ABW4LK07_9MICO
MIDYQNVHLTARDVFNPRGEAHDSLIHPMLFARRALAERNARQRAGHEHASLARVTVFRGLPHVDHDWEQHRRCLDQATEWRRAGANVELRDLKYRFQTGADGHPVLDINGKKIPVGRPKEKGIDVLCALACVREAARPDIDLVILASRDTDLVPALDEVYDFRGLDPARYARIETVSWFNSRAREERAASGGNLRPTAPRRIWNTNLDRSCYDASLDRTQYR